MAAGPTVDEVARLRHLAEIERMVHSRPEGGADLLLIVAERAQAVTAADGCLIEVIDGDEMVRRAASGLVEGSQGIRVEAAGTISGRSARLGLPLTCVDTEYDTRVDRASCRRLGVRSMAVVPVMSGDAAVGVLEVVSTEPRHFGEPELEVLQEMAGLLIGALTGPGNGPGAVQGGGAHGPAAVQGRDGHAPAGRSTGRPDARLLVECIEQAGARAARDGTPLAVFLVRLEGMAGHQDLLHRRVGESLSTAVRAGDVLARTGGEFVLVCPHTRESEAYGIAARIASAVGRVAESAPAYAGLRAAVGVAWMDDELRSPEQLLAAAEVAIAQGRMSCTSPNSCQR